MIGVPLSGVDGCANTDTGDSLAGMPKTATDPASPGAFSGVPKAKPPGFTGSFALLSPDLSISPKDFIPPGLPPENALKAVDEPPNAVKPPPAGTCISGDVLGLAKADLCVPSCEGVPNVGAVADGAG